MRGLLKTIGATILWVCLLCGALLLAILLIKGGVWLSERVLPWLSTAMAIVFWLDVIIALPLALIRKTRPVGAVALVLSSYVYGLTLWMWSLLLVATLWGIIAVVIGLILAGVGVVPIAMLATAINGEWAVTGELAFLLLLVFGSRFLGMYLGERVYPASVNE